MQGQNLEQRTQSHRGLGIALGSLATIAGNSLAGIWEYILYFHRLQDGKAIFRLNDLFPVPQLNYDRLPTVAGIGIAAIGIYTLYDALRNNSQNTYLNQ